MSHILKIMPFFLIVLILSCNSMLTTTVVNIDSINNYPEPLVKPLPLRVAALYTERFKTYDTINQISTADSDITMKIQVGKANIALYDYILSNTFEKVVYVDNIHEASKGSESIDLVIVPEVDGITYDYNLENKGLFASLFFEIIYKIGFFSPYGEQIGVWRIVGSGAKDFMIHSLTDIDPVSQIAMRKVAAKFMVGFCEQENISQLFYNECTP